MPWQQHLCEHAPDAATTHALNRGNVRHYQAAVRLQHRNLRWHETATGARGHDKQRGVCMHNTAATLVTGDRVMAL